MTILEQPIAAKRIAERKDFMDSKGNAKFMVRYRDERSFVHTGNVNYYLGSNKKVEYYPCSKIVNMIIHKAR